MNMYKSQCAMQAPIARAELSICGQPNTLAL